VIEHIGTLGDQRGLVAADTFDQRLHRLLAEFLCHLGAAAAEQAGGVAQCGVRVAPGQHHLVQPVQHRGVVAVARRGGDRGHRALDQLGLQRLGLAGFVPGDSGRELGLGLWRFGHGSPLQKAASIRTGNPADSNARLT
jgi:hypothetical protein